MTTHRRQIGSIGTAARVLTGFALIFIAGGATIAGWSIAPEEAAIGLIALPALTVALGLVAKRYARGPIRFTGLLGSALNLVVIVGLVANDVTGPEGAAIFYGSTLLIAAWRGQAGCEGTVVSNWVLGRDDQVGCAIFAPIDELEARFRQEAAIASTRR